MNSAGREYLVNHGKGGAIGRFVAAADLSPGRGARVVVRTQRGLEVGVVLRPADGQAGQWLGGVPGELLRLAGADDEAALLRLRERGEALFDDGRRLAAALALPAEVIDVEVTLDGRRAVVQYLEAAACAWDEFATALGDRHGVEVWLENLALPRAAEEPEHAEHGGCGKPDCGKSEGGGCTTCSTGGGCSSCASGKAVDLRDYFGHLRGQMEERKRVPLL